MRRCCPLLFIFLFIGCNERPQAPALSAEPVYDNPNAGVRFLAPTNWTIVARSDKPPEGPGERLLVGYQSAPNASHASFEVTIDAKPTSDDVASVVREASHGATTWELVGAPASLTIGGAPATRYTLKHKDTTKEVVAVRRGGRLFLFTLIAAANDPESRQQIRQVIDGVTWTK